MLHDKLVKVLSQEGKDADGTMEAASEPQRAEDAPREVPGMVELTHCYTSGVYAAEYIRKAHPHARKVYVVGGQGLLQEMRRVGFEADGGADEYDPASASRDELAGVPFRESSFRALQERVLKEKYDGLVVGWDLHFSFFRLVKAGAVLHQGTHFCFRAMRSMR